MGSVYSRTLGCSMSVQTVSFVISALLKTDKFYDLVGSLTTIGLVLFNYLSGTKSWQHKVQTGMILAWAIRLGSYLFTRTLLAGDWRLDKVKRKPFMFFIYWSMQGLWIFNNLLPTLSMQNYPLNHAVSIREKVGWGIAGSGLLLEAITDIQKFLFRLNEENNEKWLDKGIYSIIRYPNYLGEILFWLGLFVSASNSFTSKPEYLTVFSPLLVILLLTRISGPNA